MKDIKHLPKEKMVEATNVLFAEKVKELTFPENPTLFSHGPSSVHGGSKRKGKSLVNYFHTAGDTDNLSELQLN